MQNSGGAKQGRTVHIVPASMHHARINAFIWCFVRFLNRQGVHVGAEGDDVFIRIFPLNERHNAVAANACLVFNTKCAETRTDVLRRQGFLKREFGMLVQVASVFDDFLEKAPGKFLNSLFCHKN